MKKAQQSEPDLDLSNSSDSSRSSPSRSRQASDDEPPHQQLAAEYGFEYDLITADVETRAPPRSASHQSNRDGGEEHEYQFRLFRSTVDPTHSPSSPRTNDPAGTLKSAGREVIRLSPTPPPAPALEVIPLEDAKFVRPKRPETYYFTSALPPSAAEHLQAQYADVAVSGSQVMWRASSTTWPGTAMPWRVTRIVIPERSLHVKQDVSQETIGAAKPTPASVDSTAARITRRRPSKKRRILLRRRLAQVTDLAAQAQRLEELDREKRTRRNREKKVKRKEREKKKKADAQAVEVESLTADMRRESDDP